MAAVIARITMLLAAAAAIAVCAVWLHDARSQTAARDAASAARSPAELERAAALFRRGTALSPDAGPRLAEASTLIGAGQNRRAAAILEGVVRSEPRNARAWAGLALSTSHFDQARSAVARARALKLAPPLEHSGG
jgi:predicted Zn-dependent protease